MRRTLKNDKAIPKRRDRKHEMVYGGRHIARTRKWPLEAECGPQKKIANKWGPQTYGFEKLSFSKILR